MRTSLRLSLTVGLALATATASARTDGTAASAAEGENTAKVPRGPSTGRERPSEDPAGQEQNASAEPARGRGSTGDGASVAEPKTENYIGIFTEPISPALSAQLAEFLQPGQGLLVTRILPGSAAVKAGLKRYDILLKYDDQKLFATDQLKKLVVGDQPRRTVTLKIIRAAKPTQVDVSLGERRMPRRRLRPFRPRPGRAFPLFRRGRGGIGKEPDPGVPGAGEWPGNPGSPAGPVRGDTSRPRTSEPSGDRPNKPSSSSRTESKRPYRHLSISITATDDKRYTVRVNDTDATGKSHQRQFEGTADDIKTELKDLPPGIQDAIRDSLERTGTVKNEGRAVRFQIQPQIVGDQRHLRILMSRPAENRKMRWLKLDVQVDRSDQIDVDDLLNIEELTRELKQLAPAIRGKIEATLRQVRVPEIPLDVRNSQ